MKTRKNPDGTSHVLDDHGRVIGHFGDHKSAAKFAGEATEENNEVVHEHEKGHAQHLVLPAPQEEEPEPEPVKRSHHKKV
jgi:hypothetical protein